MQAHTCVVVLLHCKSTQHVMCAVPQAMSGDVVSVGRKIQQILVPSYFPNPEEGSVSWLQGCSEVVACYVLT